MGLREARLNNRNAVDLIIAKSKKINKAKTTTKSSGSSYEKIKDLCNLVERKLGYLKESQELLRDESSLTNYIDDAIKNGFIALDTETNGLDPICDDIVGACIYTEGRKPAYVPINHVSNITGTRLNNQLTNEQVSKELQRLVDNNVKVIYFNAKFDIRVIKNQLGIVIPPYWDGFIAGKVLKENEEEANLKYLWTKYCSPDKEAEHFTFDKLFKGYKFSLIPIETACLYAANDAIITWQLFKFQEPYLTESNSLCIECGFQRLAKLYHDIEMPIILAVAEIEDNGVCLDTNYCKQLSIKYNKLLEEKINNFNNAAIAYKDKIIQYKTTHPSCKLEDPINIGSSTQLAELFYDILQVPSVSKKQPRGTGEEILQKLNHPLCEPILEYRGVKKLLTTYIDKMPLIVNKKTNRIHCSFNQYGTDTGRFSSSDPNLQNIPSHNKDIRPMFIASAEATVNTIDKRLVLFLYDKINTINGIKYVQDLNNNDIILNNNQSLTVLNIQPSEYRTYELLLSENTKNLKVIRKHILIGSDYSQQEPKITADLSNDEQFIKDCASGKDAYATIASIAFEKPYEECLEFRPDGTVNKEGKERRSIAKVLLLGICYGKTMKSIAESLNVTEEKATEIYNAVLTNIPGLKNFMEESEEMARTYGWVETKWGRRRHIPDMQLSPYEIKTIGVKNFDPFFDSEELGVVDDTERLKQKYLQEILTAKWYKQKKMIKEKAEKDGFHIHDNVRFIEDAKRQCVNSRIQGSAADQTKIAIQNLYTCKQLRKLCWKTLLLVHDEIIGECPLVVADFCGELLSKCMIDAAKDLRTGAKCDASYCFKWYGEEIHIDKETDFSKFF